MREELGRRYRDNAPLLTRVRDRLEVETTEALKGLNHIDRVYFRVKDHDSFLNKALDPRNKPAYGDPLAEIEDQIAGRVLVFFLEDVEAVRGRLAGTFSFVESVRRKPAKDEEFGYESHHLVCVIPPQALLPDWEGRDDLPRTFELQVRTLFMHAWAEPQHDLGYKASEELPRSVKRELAWIAASAWGADGAFQRVREWQAQMGAREESGT